MCSYVDVCVSGFEGQPVLIPVGSEHFLSGVLLSLWRGRFLLCRWTNPQSSSQIILKSGKTASLHLWMFVVSEVKAQTFKITTDLNRSGQYYSTQQRVRGCEPSVFVLLLFCFPNSRGSLCAAPCPFCLCTAFIIHELSNCATQVLLAACTWPRLSAPPTCGTSCVTQRGQK